MSTPVVDDDFVPAAQAPPKSASLSATSDAPGDDDFAPQSGIAPAGGFTSDQLDYLNSTSVAKLLIDSLYQKSDSNAVLALGAILQDEYSLRSAIKILTLMGGHKEAILDVLRKPGSFSEAGEYLVAPEVKITQEMFNMKVLANAATSAANPFGYSVSPERFGTLSSDVVKVALRDDNRFPTISIHVDGVEEVYQDTDTMAMLAGFMSSFPLKATGNPIANAGTYAVAYTALSKRNAPGLFKVDTYQKVLNDIRNEYKIVNAVTARLITIKKFKLSEYVVRAYEAMTPHLVRMCEATRAMFDTDFSALPRGRFLPAELAEARKFRAINDIKDCFKEPYDLMSLKSQGVSTIRKYLRPIWDISNFATVIVAVGHSKTNNWQKLLEHVQANIETKDFFNLDPNNMSSYETRELGFKIPDATVESFWTPDWKTVKQAPYKKDVTGRVLISDVFIEQAIGQSGEVWGTNILKYAQHLSKFVAAGWVVIAKFIPTKTQASAAAQAWDWDAYWPAAFRKMYFKPYFDARMHNGEVVVLFSTTQILGTEMMEANAPNFMALSGVMQARMEWGNHTRNYLLHWGMPTYGGVHKLTPFAIQFAPDHVRRAFVEAAQKTASTSMIVDASIEQLIANKESKKAEKMEKRNNMKEALAKLDPVATSTVKIGKTITNVRRSKFL